jgi:flagellar protein FliJ
MKFKFSLDPVLRVRKHQEKVQKQKLAKEVMKQQEIDQLKTEAENKLETFLATADASQAESIQIIKQHGRHVLQAHDVMKRLNEELKSVERSVQQERNKLAAVHKKRHILEKVKEFEESEFARKVFRKEQKTLDEIATQSLSR